MGNRLFVGNLSFQTTDDDLRRTFQVHGPLNEVKLVLDQTTGRSRGFAFVEMTTDEAARRAVEALNGASLDGRALRVSEAEDRRSNLGSRTLGGNNGHQGRKPSRDR